MPGSKKFLLLPGLPANTQPSAGGTHTTDSGIKEQIMDEMNLAGPLIGHNLTGGIWATQKTDFSRFS
ncbi:hypothetical protein GCM10022409_20980 [Hymenobacter glaciei]|uniref:Uncharacterized protein n=2 Tax=Hymenobacter glaciei TaxID=877209 RepID=A0ABP7U4R2_9BACT